ncbi:hypothetical protein SK128_005368 [Halocaridina rubra]|uniref:Uncharacterized protein n=1 Tax=Halocaridina rubra TaxID=373956 RepID=A0AAN8X941_HALRR
MSTLQSCNSEKEQQARAICDNQPLPLTGHENPGEALVTQAVTSSLNTMQSDMVFSTPKNDTECVRDRVMFTEDGIDISVTCQVNSGMYEELQPKENTVSCVDEDGIRNGPLVFSEHAEKLDCNYAIACQSHGGKNCERACSNYGAPCPPEFYVKYKPDY